MEVIPADTDPETFARWCEVLRGLSPEQRLHTVVALSKRMREQTRYRIGQLRPELSAEQVEMEVRREQRGDRLFREVRWPRCSSF